MAYTSLFGGIPLSVMCSRREIPHKKKPGVNGLRRCGQPHWMIAHFSRRMVLV